MSKVMIWPDIYKEQGHWLPCINLANTLQGAGHTVKFMGIADCASIIAPYVTGPHLANFYATILSDIYPPGYTLENKLEPLDQRWKPHHLLPIAGNASAGVAGALDAIFTGPNKPDLLISGYFTGLETLLIHYKYNIPFVVLTTFLRHPADDPAIHAKTKLVYMPRALSQLLIDRVTNNSGMDIDTFIGPLEAADELIPCPRAFDFTDPDWVHGERTHYVEPMVERDSLDGTNTVPPDPVPALNLPGNNKKVIYGTSGSQVQDYEFQARTFFLSLIEMMKTQGMQDYHLILAVGDKLYSQFQLEFGIDVGGTYNTLPGNVSIFPWVSQLDIVKRADVVFMHGGLATIKESIWEKVPIVIVPHGKDQHDNAMRISKAGVGVVAEVSSLSPTDLRRLFTKAVASSWIKRRLVKLQTVFADAESAKPSLPIIQAALP